MRRLTLSFLPILLSLMLIHVQDVFAEQLIQEEFESVQQREQASVEGRTGQGWTQQSAGENPVWPVSLAGVETGMISFDLKRLGVPQAREVDTVFELLDDNGHRVLRMMVNWAAPDGRGTALFLNSLPSRDYLTFGIRLWGPAIYMGREVAVGEWVHIDLAWDDVRGEYQVHADGTLLKGGTENPSPAPGRQAVLDPRRYANEEAAIRSEPPPYPERPFQYFLERVSSVAVGNYPIPNLPAGRERSVMTSSVLDNFEIRVGSLASIKSVTHNAFSVAGYSGKLVAGDTLTVTMEAEPGGTAIFDITTIESGASGQDSIAKVEVEDVPMAEDPERPGTYTGTYTIVFGQFVEEGQVTGRFMNSMGYSAPPLSAVSSVQIDGRVRLAVKASSDLIPADRSSRAGFTITASDANGKPVQDHPLYLTLSTTDEYTGTVGGGNFEDLVGGEIDVDWDGVTDSFGEVSSQYISGFAAKTILVSAKDMISGDVGVGWVRSYIEGEVDIIVKKPKAVSLALEGSMEVSLSREWLTADGSSRSRITAVVRDADGEALPGHRIRFRLLGDNGSIREIQPRTDRRGRAYADYIAGILMGQVQVEVRDMTSGMVSMITIELRPDAPAEIVLTADPGEVEVGGLSVVAARVTDANGNPNSNVDILYDVTAGEGSVGSPSVATDEDGVALVQFTAGDTPGLATVRGTVVSREPTAEEVSAARGAVFMYGLSEEPGRLEVLEWLVEPGDEVSKGDELVRIKERGGAVYTVRAPRDGFVSVFISEERDRVEYGQTLGYVIETEE